MKMNREMAECLRKIKSGIKKAYSLIHAQNECPICGWNGRVFLEYSYPYKPGTVKVCPTCASSERHRFAYYSLKNTLREYSAATLHLAPETGIEEWLRSISREYTSVDICSPKAMLKMDIRNLSFANKSFTLVWCSHVLEHIEDDRKAMEEIFRVLKPRGLAVIMIPIYGETTFEDFKITTPADRLFHFKQEDHVRLYGMDIKGRLENVGFNVEILSTLDLPKKTVKKYSLEYPSTKEIFLCRKP